MVNYLYDLDTIEKNHEAFAEKGAGRGLARRPETIEDRIRSARSRHRAGPKKA